MWSYVEGFFMQKGYTMEEVRQILNMILHFDIYLGEVIKDNLIYAYIVVFLLVFCETGLVVTPFLPGDSLLFVVGALGSRGIVSIGVMLIILFIAAAGGNTLNFFIGRLIGKRAYSIKESRYFKYEYLDKTHMFYEKHGGKTIIIGRFLPIIRTLAPFVGGMVKMPFLKFFGNNILGSVMWVIIFVFAGFFFGNIPFVEKNFALVIAATTGISVLIGFLAYKLNIQKKPF
jgi:membrane-associated protein